MWHGENLENMLARLERLLINNKAQESKCACVCVSMLLCLVSNNGLAHASKVLIKTLVIGSKPRLSRSQIAVAPPPSPPKAVK